MPTSRENKDWAFMPSKRTPFGPHHNFALAVVTKSGNFRLLYQQANGTWKHASAGLQRMSSTSELVTHAGIGPMKGQNRSSLARVSIDPSFQMEHC